MRQTHPSGAGPTPAHHLGRNVLKILAILLMAALLCEGLYRLRVDEQTISIVMVLAIFLIAALTDGYFFGLAAAVMGVFVYDYLFINPRFGFSFTLGFPMTFFAMLLVTLITSFVTMRIRRQTQEAREKETHAELLHEINRKMLASRDETTIARYAMEYLKNHLQRSVLLYAAPTPKALGEFYFRRAKDDVGHDFFAAAAQRDAAAQAARGKNPVFSNAEESARGWYLPVLYHENFYGVFGISCKAGEIDDAQRPFVQVILEQTAQALHVQTLTARQQEALIVAEREKTRSSFLRGISHDLRTPLTSIIGASATLLESGTHMPAAMRQTLLESIEQDAQWLLRMVENILLITQIHQRDMQVTKTEEAAEEVLGEAVAQFRRRFPTALVDIEHSGALLLVPMDVVLITQVLNNLLDNAVRYAHADPVKITTGVREENGYALFSVADNGPGLTLSDPAQLFAIRPQQKGAQGDASRGLGIGLSLCKTILQAHGGYIRGENLSGGGACFSFGLPLERGGAHAQ